MAYNPVSFRTAFESQISKLPEEHQTVIRTQMNAITDLQGAIPALKNAIDALTPSTTSATSSSSGNTSVTENITTINNIFSGGKVNNQTGVDSYITAQGDNGALVVLSNASPIAISLNNSVTLPFWCTLSNQGSTVATCTPIQGTINGGATLDIPGGSWVSCYFDGNNWWAESPGTTAGGVTQIIAGTGITISPTGGVGIITINATGSGPEYSLGGALSSGNIALGSGAGSGATLNAIAGLDGVHRVEITSGTSPATNSPVWTCTFTTPRGNTTYPQIQCTAVSVGGTFVEVSSAGGSASNYSAYVDPGASLASGTSYIWNVSCP